MPDTTTDLKRQKDNERDAVRYRWLRHPENVPHVYDELGQLGGEELDKAIDLCIGCGDMLTGP